MLSVNSFIETKARIQIISIAGFLQILLFMLIEMTCGFNFISVVVMLFQAKVHGQEFISTWTIGRQLYIAIIGIFYIILTECFYVILLKKKISLTDTNFKKIIMSSVKKNLFKESMYSTL